MNKRQMYRLVCAYNAQYLASGNQSDGLTALLSEADMARFIEAQDRLIENLMKQAGLGCLPHNETGLIAAINGAQ